MKLDILVYGVTGNTPACRQAGLIQNQTFPGRSVASTLNEA